MKLNLKPAEWLLVAVIAWALIGLLYTPYDSYAQDYTGRVFEKPSLEHWFGIDALGRDQFSRIWQGSGSSVSMGVIATLANLLIAGLLLVVEQNSPPWLKRAIQSIVAGWLAIPVMFVALLFLVYFSQGPGVLIAAAALGNVPFTFRQLRILWLHQKETLYVKASVVLGSRSWGLFRKTIWPNLKPDVWGLSRLVFAFSVLEISGLAFLGLLGDPDFPELGSILRFNKSYITTDWLQIFWPVLFLSGILFIVQLTRAKETDD